MKFALLFYGPNSVGAGNFYFWYANGPKLCPSLSWQKTLVYTLTDPFPWPSLLSSYIWCHLRWAMSSSFRLMLEDAKTNRTSFSLNMFAYRLKFQDVNQLGSASASKSEIKSRTFQLVRNNFVIIFIWFELPFQFYVLFLSSFPMKSIVEINSSHTPFTDEEKHGSVSRINISITDQSAKMIPLC